MNIMKNFTMFIYNNRAIFCTLIGRQPRSMRADHGNNMIAPLVIIISVLCLDVQL